MPSINPYIEEQCRALWGKRVADQEETIRTLKATVSKLRDELYKIQAQARLGNEIAKMLSGIRENPSASELWDEILVLLQFDKFKT